MRREGGVACCTRCGGAGEGGEEGQLWQWEGDAAELEEERGEREGGGGGGEVGDDEEMGGCLVGVFGELYGVVR